MTTTSTTREAAVRKLKSRLDQFNNDLAALEAKASSVKESARDELKGTLAELKQKRDEAQVQLGQLGDATGAAFDDMLDGMEQGWDQVSASFERARQRFH